MNLYRSGKSLRSIDQRMNSTVLSSAKHNAIQWKKKRCGKVPSPLLLLSQFLFTCIKTSPSHQPFVEPATGDRAATSQSNDNCQQGCFGESRALLFGQDAPSPPSLMSTYYDRLEGPTPYFGQTCIEDDIHISNFFTMEDSDGSDNGELSLECDTSYEDTELDDSRSLLYHRNQSRRFRKALKMRGIRLFLTQMHFRPSLQKPSKYYAMHQEKYDCM